MKVFTLNRTVFSDSRGKLAQSCISRTRICVPMGNGCALQRYQFSITPRRRTRQGFGCTLGCNVLHRLLQELGIQRRYQLFRHARALPQISRNNLQNR